jgi:DNA replication and repair protein RecF
MRITNVNIARFRNLEMSSGINLFWGENGHGKTNLLESIGIILNGTTPRATRLAEVIPHEGDFAKWSIDIDAEDVHHSAECIVRRGETRRILINGQARKKLPGPDHGVYALTFFPEDFRILTDEPYYRRRFIDEAILLTEPQYASILRKYRDAHDNRNALMKSGRANDSSLLPYEELLANFGLEITERRARAVDELDRHLASLIENVFSDEVTINVSYKPSFGEYLNQDYPEKSIIDAYRTSRSRDMAAKRTLLGPHRDDIESNFRGEDIRQFASRGEIRLSVVALIIAKYYMFSTRWNLKPVVLLDDIFSELDSSRRQKVLKALPQNCQLMITAVDRDLSHKWLEESGDVSLFRVIDGKIEPDLR